MNHDESPSWLDVLVAVFFVLMVVGYLVDGHLTDCRRRVAERCAASMHKNYGHLHRVDCVR